MPVREADAGAAREMRQQSIWAAGPRVVRYGCKGFSSRVGMPEWVLRLFDQLLQPHRFRMVHSREADAFFRCVAASLRLLHSREADASVGLTCFARRMSP